MIDILTASASVLAHVGFTTNRTSFSGREALIFEDPTVLGFLFGYGDAAELLESWESDADHAVTANQFGLRRAAQKAWNVYVVLLAVRPANAQQSIALGAVEEDLTGTRKIARAGVREIADLRAGLLPLLPLQSAPRLEPVDMSAEIRERTTELAARAVEAFLSTTADEAVVVHVLEETP